MSRALTFKIFIVFLIISFAIYLSISNKYDEKGNINNAFPNLISNLKNINKITIQDLNTQQSISKDGEKWYLDNYNKYHRYVDLMEDNIDLNKNEGITPSEFPVEENTIAETTIDKSNEKADKLKNETAPKEIESKAVTKLVNNKPTTSSEIKQKKELPI